MATTQPEDNELAVTTNKLEQAIKKLAEKDREIASLKEELSRLRGYNFEDTDQLYSTPSTVVKCMCGRDSRRYASLDSETFVEPYVNNTHLLTTHTNTQH